MQVEVWSDVVCPWCYIGKRRLESALEQFPHRDQVEVVWRSFQLDPSVPEGTTHPTLPALAAKYGTQRGGDAREHEPRVEQVAADEGLEYHLADGVSGNTLLAHELLHLAAEHGKRNELKERLLHAYFEEGRPVFDVDSLVPFAVEVGLDEAEVREALADRRYLAAVRAGRRDRTGARRDRRPLLRRRPEVRRRRCAAGRAAAADPGAGLGRRPPARHRPRGRGLRATAPAPSDSRAAAVPPAAPSPPRRPARGRRRWPTARSSPGRRTPRRRPGRWPGRRCGGPRPPAGGRPGSSRSSSSRPCHSRLKSLASARPGQRSGQAAPSATSNARVSTVSSPVAARTRSRRAGELSPSVHDSSGVPIHTPAAPATRAAAIPPPGRDAAGRHHRAGRSA